MTQSKEFMTYLESNKERICLITSRSDFEEALNEFFKLLVASKHVYSDEKKGLKRTRLILEA